MTTQPQDQFGSPIALNQPQGQPPLLGFIPLPYAQCTGANITIPPAQYIYLDNHGGDPLVLTFLLSSGVTLEFLLDAHGKLFVALPGQATQINVYDLALPSVLSAPGPITGSSGIVAGYPLDNPVEYAASQGPYLAITLSDTPWSIFTYDRGGGGGSAIGPERRTELQPLVVQGTPDVENVDTRSMSTLALDVVVLQTHGGATGWNITIYRLDALTNQIQVAAQTGLLTTDNYSIDFGPGAGPLLTEYLNIKIDVNGPPGASLNMSISAIGH